MNFLTSYLILFLEYPITYLLCCAFLHTPVKKSLKRALCALPMSLLVVFLLPYIENSTYGTILCSFLIFLFLCFCFQKRPFELLIIYVLCYVIIFFFETITIFIFSLLDISIITANISIIANLLTLLFALFLYFFVPIYKICDFISTPNRYVLTIFIDLYLGSFFFMMIGKSTQTNTNFVLLFFQMSLILLLNLDMLHFQKNYDIQKQELENYEQYLPIIEELIDYIRIRQHDFNNHLQAIHMLPLTYTDYDSLKDALFSYETKINLNNEQLNLLKLNLKLVSGFIISKMAECEEQQKKLQVEILNYSLQSNVPEYTLIELLGVLIDNAREASPKGESIFLQLNSAKNQVHFTIKNIGPELTPQLRTLFFQKGYSTKQDADSTHGLGLYKLKKITDSYHGMIILDNELIDGKQMICFELVV